MDKKSNYGEALINAYNNNVLKIVWNTVGFSIAVDSENEKLIPEIREKNFVDYVFSVIKIVLDLVEERDLGIYDVDDVKVARKIYEKEHDLKNHLYIKKNCLIDCFKSFEYEIISHRNFEKPEIMETSSSVIKIVTEKTGEEQQHIFEISKRDLRDIINKLLEIDEKMNSLKEG